MRLALVQDTDTNVVIIIGGAFPYHQPYLATDKSRFLSPRSASSFSSCDSGNIYNTYQAILLAAMLAAGDSVCTKMCCGPV